MENLSAISPQVSVVVPIFNQAHLTERCLRSLLANSHSNFEVIVVNNASTDHSVALLQAMQLLFTEQKVAFQIISNQQNVGFGRAMNQGARVAQGKYLALLNNDTWLMPGWDLGLITSIEKYHCSMVCPYYYEGPFENELAINDRAQQFVKKNQGKKCRQWGSILMFFRRDDFFTVGMFDEDFFVSYEDTDLQERCDRQGLKYYLVGNVFLWHHSKGTRGKDQAPSLLESQGLAIFQAKWGFDPQLRRNSFWARQVKSFRKWKRHYGYL